MTAPRGVVYTVVWRPGHAPRRHTTQRTSTNKHKPQPTALTLYLWRKRAPLRSVCVPSRRVCVHVYCYLLRRSRLRTRPTCRRSTARRTACATAGASTRRPPGRAATPWSGSSPHGWTRCTACVGRGRPSRRATPPPWRAPRPAGRCRGPRCRRGASERQGARLARRRRRRPARRGAPPTADSAGSARCERRAAAARRVASRTGARRPTRPAAPHGHARPPPAPPRAGRARGRRQRRSDFG